MVSCKKSLERYCAERSEFANSRECKLLLSLHKSIEAFDSDAFSNAAAEYDAITKLLPWQISVLLKVKDGIDMDDLT